MASLPALVLDPTPVVDEDRRETLREDLTLGLTLRIAGTDVVIPAAITNLSARGFLAEIPYGIATPKILHVDMPQAGHRTANVVWTNGRLLGCTFAVPLSKAEISAAHLKSEPRLLSADPLESMRHLISETAPEEEKWSLRVRFAIIMGAGALPWMAIGGIAALMF